MNAFISPCLDSWIHFQQQQFLWQLVLSTASGFIEEQIVVKLVGTNNDPYSLGKVKCRREALQNMNKVGL